MKLTEYQDLIKNYDEYPRDLGPYYIILGIQQSSGKLSEKLKAILDNKDAVEITDKDKVSISISLGDILYNIVTMANALNIPLENIVSLNLRKLSMLKEKKIDELLKNKKEDK